MAIDEQIPANAYSAIATGRREQRQYETQSGVPVDGSNQLLRDPTYGSPFTVRLLPPDILLESLNAEESSTSVTILDSAMQVNDRFSEYEQRIEAFRSNPVYAQQVNPSLQKFISANGVQFDAQTARSSRANDLAFADIRQAQSVISQMQAMVNTPPLTLLINPQTLVITRSKKQQYSDRGRLGKIFDAWGEEQVRLSISGKTGAWYAGTRFTDSDAPQNFRGLGAARQGNVSQTTAPSGVQYFNKNNSAAWQNLQQLRVFYQNNGYLFDIVGDSEAHQWIGAVAIDYDQWTYVGHFDSFGFGETESTARGGVEFNMEFTANFVYDHGQREFQVLPISSPTPSPADTLWANPATAQPTRTPASGPGVSIAEAPSAGAIDPLRQALIRSQS